MMLFRWIYKVSSREIGEELILDMGMFIKLYFTGIDMGICSCTKTL